MGYTGCNPGSESIICRVKGLGLANWTEEATSSGLECVARPEGPSLDGPDKVVEAPVVESQRESLVVLADRANDDSLVFDCQEATAAVVTDNACTSAEMASGMSDSPHKEMGENTGAVWEKTIPVDDGHL